MGLWLEQHIATRTPAGRAGKIFRKIRIALALALCGAPPQAPLAQQLPQATAAVLGNAGSARAAVVAHSRSHDSVVPCANAAKSRAASWQG